MIVLAFTIPGPPVPCGRARVTRRGTFTPDRTRRYEAHVALCARVAVARANGFPLAGDVAVRLDVYRVARRGDCDNFAKSVLDGMRRIVFADDRQVQRLDVRMFVDRARPRVEVRVGPVETSDDAAA